MEFEDMQVIWNSENHEKLYAINEAALHKQIRGKGRSVDRYLMLFDVVMIVLQFAVGVFLVFEAWRDAEPAYAYILPGTYIAVSLVALLFRVVRGRNTQQFDNSMIGDLNKAIWQLEWLIERTTSFWKWYLAPLIIALIITSFFTTPQWLLWGAFLLALFVGSAGAQWEVRKWHRPKLESLLAIREKLLESPPTQ